MSVAIGRITTFNPITAAGGYEYAVFRLIWGGVAVPTPEAEIVPDQIEQWSVSPDARTWTFTLRRGLKWSDGRPATAQDLVFTLTGPRPRTGNICRSAHHHRGRARLRRGTGANRLGHQTGG
jgi:MarR-like DNA-binding transcriptional regulator SgrR of sgrS sRNA